MSSLSDQVEKWDRLLAATLEEESFGQVIEATEGYGNLIGLVKAVLDDRGEAKKTFAPLTTDERAALVKLQRCFVARKQAIAQPTAGQAVSLDDMRTIQKNFKKIFKGGPFPIDTMHLSGIKVSSQEEDEDAPFQDENKGALLPCPTKLRPGETVVKLSISNIGLKDATTYLDPFFHISVRDVEGNELEPEQDTPHPVGPRKDKSVQFDCTVYLQTPLSRLPDDAAVFFEFRHWKPKKNKISTRCWSMLTVEEIQKHKETSLTLEMCVARSQTRSLVFMEVHRYILPKVNVSLRGIPKCGMNGLERSLRKFSSPKFYPICHQKLPRERI
eukprot:EG_transcript_16932